MLILQKKARTLTAWAIFTIFFAQASLCQSKRAKAAESMRFQHLGPEHGLANNYVANTLRDSRGFLWLATLDGLSRYDGIDFKTYRHEPDNPYSLSRNDVSTLAEDAEGYLWIGTRGGGLNRFDFNTDRVVRYQHDPGDSDSLSHNTVTALHIDQQQRLWVSTQGGLNRLDPGSEKFVRYQHDPSDPASIHSNSISYACSDKTGNIWVSSSTHGLTRLNPAINKFTHYPHQPDNPNSPADNYVWTVYCAPDGFIWFSTYRVLTRFNPTTKQFKHYHHDPENLNSFSKSFATSILTDNNGKMWISTSSRALSQFDPVTEHFSHYYHDPHDPHSPSSNYALHVQIDSSGMLWLSSFDKVSYTTLMPPRFFNYTYNPLLANSISYPVVTSVAIDPKGEYIWLGILDGGLNRLNPLTNEIKTYRHDPDNPATLSHDRIMTLGFAPDGILWIGTGDGLNRFDPATEEFTRYFKSRGSNITNIYSLAVDSQGKVWFTGPVGLHGLYRFDPGVKEAHEFLRNFEPAIDSGAKSLTSYRYVSGGPDSPNSSLLHAITIDQQDNVWVGSQDNGFSYLDTRKNQFTHYVASDQPGGLNGDKANMVYEASDGAIWITTSGGLNRFDKKANRFKTYQMAQGLPVNDVVSITEDLQGQLWLGTTRGIARFDPDSETFRNFDRFDGLPGESFYLRSVARMANGRLFFGGRNGLSTFYPEKLSDNPYKPPVFITDFQLFNQSVPVGDNSPLQQAIGATRKITLTHEQSVFSFKFAALNLLHPVKNRYAYKLHGFDSGWTYTGSNQHFATYTNLDPGEYTFQVKASNNDAVWNEQGVSVELIVLPPWWETLWFRAVALILATLLIVGGVRWRLYAIAAQRNLLEVQVKQRTRQLSRRTEELKQRTQELSSRTEELNIANHSIRQLNERLESENLRMSAELDVSKRMQQMLLPSTEELAEIKDLDISVFMQPADEVSGDYYDVMTEDGRVMIAIGDVTGHGLESGIMMILVQAGVHTLLADGVHEPSHFIKTLNRMVHGHVKRMASEKNLTLMLLDYQDGQVRFSGQHEELLWVSQEGKVQRIDTIELGFMVGVQRNIERFTNDAERELRPGEGIVLYTDGITEAMDETGEEYGIDRLCEIIGHHWQEPAEEIQQAIIRDVLTYLGGQKPLDDLTLVVVKRHAYTHAVVPVLEAAAG